MDQALDLGTRHLAPSFVRCRGIRERWYIVGDPTFLLAGERLTDTATIEQKPSWARRTTVLAIGLTGGGLFGVQYYNVAAVVVFAIVGLLIGVIVVAVTEERRRQRREARGDGRVVRVEPRDREAWELCELAAQLGTTQAWSSELVDQDRVVPQLLWRVVRAVGRLTAMKADFADAEGHPGLADLAGEGRRRVEQLSVELEAIRQGLREILSAARELDAREQAQRAEQKRREDEAALRERLTGSMAVPLEPLADAVDTVEGVQAVAVAVNELLIETDHMTLRLDSLDR